MSMTIANDIGVTPHAWLDAGLLHESCAGYRCRLFVGDAGGIVCDMVTGPWPLDADGVARIATAAVVNTDPLENAPLPIEDQNGHPARIIADEEHVVEAGALARNHAAPQIPENIEVTVALPLIPLGAMLVVLIAGIAMVIMDAVTIGMVNIILGGIGLMAILNSQTRSGMQSGRDVRTKAVAAVLREIERRDRLPETVTTG